MFFKIPSSNIIKLDLKFEHGDLIESIEWVSFLPQTMERLTINLQPWRNFGLRPIKSHLETSLKSKIKHISIKYYSNYFRPVSELMKMFHTFTED